MRQADLLAEVQALVEARIERREPTAKGWLTQAILDEHRALSGADADWYLLCAREHVADTVGLVVRRYKPGKEDPDPQIVLPGFERLQKAYSVERDGEQTIVPAALLSDAEIQTKVDELRAMAAGCRQHANELERFMAERAA